MRAFAAEKRRIWLLVFSLGLASGLAPSPAVAQSLTSGSLRGTVQTADEALSRVLRSP